MLTREATALPHLVDGEQISMQEITRVAEKMGGPTEAGAHILGHEAFLRLRGSVVLSKILSSLRLAARLAENSSHDRTDLCRTSKSFPRSGETLSKIIRLAIQMGYHRKATPTASVRHRCKVLPLVTHTHYPAYTRIHKEQSVANLGFQHFQIFRLARTVS